MSPLELAAVVVGTATALLLGYFGGMRRRRDWRLVPLLIAGAFLAVWLFNQSGVGIHPSQYAGKPKRERRQLGWQDPKVWIMSAGLLIGLAMAEGKRQTDYS